MYIDNKYVCCIIVINISFTFKKNNEKAGNNFRSYLVLYGLNV